MSNCVEYPEMISAYIDGELSDADKLRLEAHLIDCEHCSSLLEIYRGISSAINDSLEPAPQSLSEGVMQRIAGVDAAQIASNTKKFKIVGMLMTKVLPAAACLAFLLLTVPRLFGISKQLSASQNDSALMTPSISGSSSSPGAQPPWPGAQSSPGAAPSGVTGGIFDTEHEEERAEASMGDADEDSNYASRDESGIEIAPASSPGYTPDPASFGESAAEPAPSPSLSPPLTQPSSPSPSPALSSSSPSSAPPSVSLPPERNDQDAGPGTEPGAGLGTGPGAGPGTEEAPLLGFATEAMTDPSAPESFIEVEETPEEDSISGEYGIAPETSLSIPGATAEAEPGLTTDQAPESIIDAEPLAPGEAGGETTAFGDADAPLSGVYAIITIHGDLPAILERQSPDTISSNGELTYTIDRDVAIALIGEISGSDGVTINLIDENGDRALVCYTPGD